ncbi:uncharacterized protein LOC127282392 [Leptopilina boulardi]|uniref:uncharacterized protein LOC127282392 n=1 Tax=Leptopilina boulardi TaxID=63433 RepID=UPI0021F58303|nr:uncharacterized protein LOC127282392 [Leptopilina boulardi]
MCNMNIMQGSYYNLNYRISYAIGQWPYLNKSQKIIRITAIFFCIQSINIPMFFGLLNALGDINLTMECVSPLVFANLCLLMSVNSINTSKKLLILVEKIEKDWLIWSAEPEIEILKKHAQDGKKFRMVYFASMFGACISFFFIPIMPRILDWIQPLNESRELLPIYLADYKIIDIEKYYFPIFFHNYICTIWIMLILINNDTMFILCTQHACAILAAMGSKLTNLVDNQFSPKRDKYLRMKIDSDIIFCAKQHKELIAFLENIHKCFSFLFLLGVVSNMLMISVTGFQAATKINNPAETLRFSVETSVHVIHIYLITVPCQQLIDTSLSLSDSIYKSNWYLLPTHSRKSLLIIMRRSSEPLEFMVGKLYTYSMRNFGMVIKTSISYFTVLVSLQ